jgi:Tol biopolymer transport system component
MIAAGSTVGQYRVEALIGRGGMGEVYKATDTRLGRPVALKVLSAEMSRSSERLRRFLNEAKAASSLNHPNILTVYDAGETPLDGGGTVHFIASELIEGKTLRELIHRDRVPFHRIVDYLAQAADGISKAHAANIVHRDLKPENIMVTADGFAKVLDFGLAKLIDASDADSAAAGLTRTREGAVLGTVAYMSPEQARGERVDHRSDIFSFGSILYEAVARRAPFSGVSEPDILYRIAHQDPAPLAGATDGIARLVTRTLAKDPAERMQSMKDLALELRELQREGVRIPARRFGGMPVAIVALAATALLGYLYRAGPKPDLLPVRFSINAPESTSISGTPNSATALQFALSADGQRVVFVAAAAGEKPRLWLRELASLESRPLAGTEGAFFPFWSPDGTAVAFFADDELRRVSLSGGAPTVLAKRVGDPRGGTWSRSGVILFSGVDGQTGLVRAPAAGGEAVAVTPREFEDSNPPRWPSFLPDGDRFLFLGLGNARLRSAIYSGSLSSGKTERLFEADSKGEFVAPDRIVFMRKGALMSQQVDSVTLRPRGDAVLIQRTVGYAPVIYFSAFSAREHVLAFAPWTNPNRRLTWLDRRGTIVGTASDPADWGTTSLSLRDGKAALTRIDPDSGNLDIWSVDVARGVASPIVSSDADENRPVWSADASSIAFSSSYGATLEIKIANLVEGSQRVVASHPGRIDDWTSDGRFIVQSRRSTASGGDIWLLSTQAGIADRAFLATPYYEAEGRVSPDGRWIAYTANDTGREEIYLRPFPAGGEPYRVTTEGGTQAKWSPDGRELFFVTAANEIASTRVSMRREHVEATRPAVLFRIPGVVPPPNPFWTAYEVAPDGRFLITVAAAGRSTASITISVNWREQ